MKSRYQKEYDAYQAAVKSYFDLFDKIKTMVKNHHNLDEAGFTRWMTSPQETLAGYTPMTILKRNDIFFIYERYSSLLKTQTKSIKHKS
jgi:hypothetical protein